MRRHLLAMAVVAAMAASTALATPAGAAHSSGYHWARTANPFTLKIDDNVSAAWDTHLNTAAADWSLSSVLDTTVVQGSFGSRTSCSPLTGQVEVCNARFGNTGWLTILSISTTTGNHITKASVKLNDSYFGVAPYNTAAWRQMIMCEQIGHTLGLANQDNNPSNPNLGSCMDSTANPAGPPSNEHPDIHDYEELAIIYEHLDSFTTPTLTSGANNHLADWGTLVSGSADHGVGTFRRDLGNGNAVVTRVVWAS